MSRRSQSGDTLVLHYRLGVAGNPDLECTFDADPVELVLGQGEFALEQWLEGLLPGERYVFQLDPEQAYGPRHDELLQDLPRSLFTPEMLVLDNWIEFDGPEGQTLPGRILDMNGDQVTVDFNHPLAGSPVELEVEIREIR